MTRRFLNVSPRAYIRQKDSVNILPSIVRTGYQSASGISSGTFYENDNTVIFGEGRSVLAPYMIPSNLAAMSGFLTGNLVLSATLQPGTAYLDQAVENRPISPFIEGSNSAIYFNLEDENEGFSENIYPGFSSDESSKSAITFNIPSNQATFVYKLNRQESLRDPSGPFYNQPGSGFVYYNAALRRWTDMGIRDPSTSIPKLYNPTFGLVANPTTANGYYQISVGENQYMCQFSSSPYSILSEKSIYEPQDDDALKARGYDKIGNPTSYFGAPNSPRYHAPDSHTIKMSEYIKHPFVVDRITLNLPVTFYRTQIPYTGSGASIDSGFGKDIDNYVFFVYVQNRSNAARDTRQDVSSSIRYLVANKSFCAYNRDTIDSVKADQALLHDVGYSHEFTFLSDEATTSGSVVQKSKIADLSMTFRPRTYDNCFGAVSKMAGAAFISATSTKITGSVFIPHFWKGGQIGTGSLGNVGRLDSTRNLNIRSGSIPGNFEENLLANASPRSLIDSHWIGKAKFVTSGSGLGESGFEMNTATIGIPYRETPIVLFPEDEIIFGIESGVNPNLLTPDRVYQGLDYDVLNITGSRLQIRDGDAKVVFYGSTVAEKREKLPTLNQYLGSDAVHEDIHEEGPFDQFDIFPKLVFSCSYIDNVFTGKNRRRTALMTLGQGWITGSFQRNVRHINRQSLYYDTLVPAVSTMSGGLANTVTGFVTPAEKTLAVVESQVLKIVADPVNDYAFDNNRGGNSLLKRSFTYENSLPNEKRIKNFELRLYDSSLSLISTSTSTRAKIKIFYNGMNPRYENVDNSHYTGSCSLRYGLLSTELVGPSNVFRRDRYGQFRDMLEQSRDSKLFSTTTKGREAVGNAVVTAMFVSASSNTQTNGVFTQCSNLSFECTSSVPFVDGVARNRGDNVPAYTAKFGANNLLFGVTGSFGVQ